jgi:hypothetical protein
MAILDAFADKNQKRISKQEELNSKFLNKESVVGSKIFGPKPHDGRREFFCLDEFTWVWHEEWYDKYTEKQVQTTRYDVRTNGIYKSVNGGHVSALTPDETKSFQDAVKEYVKRVKKEVYNQESNDPA